MFTAQFAEHILNKLAAHKRLVQLTISGVVVGDTCRNLYTVSQLAAQRFKEIEEEEHAERVEVTASLFKQLATRCHGDDGSDFWPAAISKAAGVLHVSSSTPATTTASTTLPIKFNIIEELLRPNSTSTTATEHASTSDVASKPHYSIEDLSEHQDYSQPTTTTAHATATAIATAAPSTPPVIYITWDDVWTHLFHTLQQTVQFVASTVEERSGESPLLCAAREQKQWLAQVALGTVDSTREWCRGAMIWPQIEVQRVSAVRYRFDWHGITFPVLSTSKITSHLERAAVDLTHAL